MVLPGRNEIIGVDVGSYTVKIVRLGRHRGQWSVQAGGIAEISQKRSSSPSQKEANCVRAAQSCMRMARVNTRLAVCSVGGSDVAVRNFEFPLLPEDELENAVLFEARQVCPFTTTDIVVDYNIVSQNEKRMKGYLVAATNNLIDDRVRLIKKARLNCTLMDIDALALLNCFKEIEKPESNHGIAVLNIGGSKTTLAIEGNDGWPFVRNLGFNGEKEIWRIAAENDITPDEVKDFLSDRSKEIPDAINEALQNAAGELAVDIDKTLRYYSAQENSFNIDTILVCGGFALFERFVDYLDIKLPIQVKVWNPFEKMHCKVSIHSGALLKNIIRKSGPSLVVAAGLAMRTI